MPCSYSDFVGFEEDFEIFPGIGAEMFQEVVATGNF